MGSFELQKVTLSKKSSIALKSSKFIFRELCIFATSAIFTGFEGHNSFLIDKLNQMVKRNNLILIGLILLIAISSIIYLDFRQTDYEREKEVLKIAEFVSKLDGKSNDYGQEAYYVEVMDLNGKEFPILSNQINFKSKIVLLEGNTIIERINDARDKEVSYLIVTSNSTDKIFLDIYDNEEDYAYLEKIFDSNENNSKFKVKIFKIDFIKFDS